MKKFLLSCMLACGLGASAQTVIFSDNFETTDTGTIGTWQSGGFGSLTQYPYNDFTVRGNCPVNLINGTKSLQIVQIANEAQDNDRSLALCDYANGSAGNAGFAPLVYTQITANDYKNLTLSYVWKCQGQNNQDYGQLMYSKDGLTWTSLVTNLTSGTAPYTKTVTDYALPAALNFQTFYIGWRFLYNTTTLGQPGFTIDDVVVKGVAPTAVPACSAITSPVAGSSISSGSVNITWSASADAAAYKLTVGTTPGGSDTFVGTLTALSQAVPLAINKTYYAKVVPTNVIGDAEGCQEITFSTNATVAYCAASGANSTFEKITNVSFADINNPSSADATATGYEDFTAIVGSVNRESSYPFTALCSVGTYPTDQVLVWIDFNQNGNFNDEGELVLTTTPGEQPWTGEIAIPASSMLGNTRMRVRIQDTTAAPNSTACGASTYGQVEDYTLDIKSVLAVDASVKASASVYPNPFHDILNISDVKGVKAISISDVSGRQVKNMTPSTALNLSELKAGLYIVTLQMEDGTVKSIKAIKK